MLDRPTTRKGRLARAAALKIEGRVVIDGAYVAAADGAPRAEPPLPQGGLACAAAKRKLLAEERMHGRTS
jgi:hypothetical protein